jgi:hypothetical protein
MGLKGDIRELTVLADEREVVSGAPPDCEWPERDFEISFQL